MFDAGFFGWYGGIGIIVFFVFLLLNLVCSLVWYLIFKKIWISIVSLVLLLFLFFVLDLDIAAVVHAGMLFVVIIVLVISKIYANKKENK